MKLRPAWYLDDSSVMASCANVAAPVHNNNNRPCHVIGLNVVNSNSTSDHVLINVKKKHHIPFGFAQISQLLDIDISNRRKAKPHPLNWQPSDPRAKQAVTKE